MSIELKNISKKYSDFHLRNINFRVEKGEYFVILGRSGAGKSLIMEIIAGFKKPDLGQIFVNEEEITDQKIQKRKIAVVFQDLSFFPHKTVRQNIAYPLKGKKTKQEKETIISELTKKLNIEHLLNKKSSEMSGGEIQRAVIARTLAAEPEILLLDEPTSALDVQLKSEVRTILKEITKTGISVIHITHDFDEAVRLADKVAIINKGKILQTGTVKDVFSRPKSKFAANLAGINNFYKATIQTIDNSNTKLAEINNNTKFYVLTEDEIGFGFIIVKSHDVILSDAYNLSSARNTFEGIVTKVCPASLGIEVEVDIGINISSLITESYVEKMDIKKGSKIWVSFKASAVKFIKIK